jgi:Ca2+-binding EF-hand superfamily protein
MMVRVLTERRYRPANEEQLLKAFTVLDKEQKGHLTVDELRKYMMEEGEHFTQEEMDEMLQASVDPEKEVILYKDYVTLMTMDDSSS